ncbi:MAG: MarR family transcriptional regulator [Rectinema sp.]|nr:MarR family transcriptional regulator [Rectinema sp.]
MKSLSSESELSLLEAIHALSQARESGLDSPVSQRALACESGLSLGMTNALLRQFVERGWVKLMHLNSRKMQYALTQAGIEEISRRTIDFFVRAARNASRYRRHVEAFVDAIIKDGYTTLILVGPDELDFLFDFACEKRGLRFLKSQNGRHVPDPGTGKAVFIITCENMTLKNNLPSDALVIDFSYLINLPASSRESNSQDT